MTQNKSTSSKDTKDKIFTRDFCLISLANFLLFLFFYAITPVMPYFLSEVINASDSLIGMIIASYSVAVIFARPISGWMLDTLRNKPIYIISYACFVLLFPCYALTTILGIIILIRALHGFAFGLTTSAGTTIVTYLVPSKRLGEGLGLYGLANTLSMALGPLLGIFLHQHMDYNMLFFTTSLIVLVGLILAAMVRVPHVHKPREKRSIIRNLILIPAIIPTIALLMASIPYGVSTTYIVLLADEYGISAGSGLFYTTMAVGLGLSRVFGGKLVDKYSIPKIITVSFFLITLAYLCLSTVTNYFGFIFSALLVGLSYGVVHPAVNTLFVKIGGPALRGTATSTYFTGWDIGLGLGIVAGGFVAEHFSAYQPAFLSCVGAVGMGIIIFLIWAKMSKSTLKAAGTL